MDRRQFIAIAIVGSLFPRGSILLACPPQTAGLSLIANTEHLLEIGAGWLPTVTATLEKEKMTAVDPKLEIRQIKQKFGGLRLYYKSKHREQLIPIVREAELRCENTCENCGRPGNAANLNGWIRTSCKEHRHKG